ncbi:MAG: CYTH domain-containing protein [Desulfobacterales bacterium]|nr:CYTH domain-containing protein [Desulfobacterales bacterium]
MEIERKFLVAEPPPELDSVARVSIRQGYVAIDDSNFELRFRQKDESFYQTIKQGSGLVRQEYEIALTRDQFNLVWPLTEGRRIQKVRYKLPAGDLICEVDIFGEPLKGLQLVEVEFDTLEQSSSFVPLNWFGNEVTDDSRYKNRHLALHGLPKTLNV